MNKFNLMLRKLRTDAKLTQSELAEKLKITRSTIGMYETGKREPDFETLELIADFFNVDMNYLLGKNNTTTKLVFDKKKEYHPELTAKDERDIAKLLNKSLENLEKSQDGLMFDGEYMDLDEESRELLKASLENTIRMAKRLAKEKYTPNKYRN